MAIFCDTDCAASCDGYCRHHRRQDDRPSTTTQRYRKTWDINSYGNVAFSPTREVNTHVCQGVYITSRNPCKKPPKSGYDYCCYSHNPSLRHISPSIFSSKTRTRAYLEDEVVVRYKGKDAYHFDALDLTTPGFIEMDHIVEKQCFSYAFYNMNFRDGLGEMHFVARIVRDDIVNKVSNLCLTRMETNRIKGAAVWKYLDDCITGHVGLYGNPATFTGYMIAETRDRVHLGRQTTSVITKAMGVSLKRCQRQLADEGDTPILAALAAELQRLYALMQPQTRERH